jgi:hypothetical protein
MIILAKNVSLIWKAHNQRNCTYLLNFKFQCIELRERDLLYLTYSW